MAGCVVEGVDVLELSDVSESLSIIQPCNLRTVICFFAKLGQGAQEQCWQHGTANVRIKGSAAKYPVSK